MIKIRVYSETESFYKTFKGFKSLKRWLLNNPDFKDDRLSIILV